MVFLRSAAEPYVFISYRRKDLNAVRGLATALDTAFGDDHVFFDIADIHAGARWDALLHTQVVASDVLVVALSEHWVSELAQRDPATDFVVREISIALQERIPIIPVLLPGVALPTSGSLPEQIRGLLDFQATTMRNESWEEGVTDLITCVAKVAGALDGDARKRKINEARGMALWFETAASNETVLARVSGTKESDPILIISDRRLVTVSAGKVAELTEISIEDVFAVRHSKSDLWLLDQESERHFPRLDAAAVTRFVEALTTLAPTLDVRQGRPDDELRRARRIAHARAFLHIDDEVVAAASDSEGGAVLLVRPDETVISRRKKAQDGSIVIPHESLGAVCAHKDSVWLFSAQGEQRVNQLTERDVDQLTLALRELAPKAQLYRKPPDRQVRENLLIFDSKGTAARHGIDLQWTTWARPTEEEAVVLAVTKLHLMERDLAVDPDWEDRAEKGKAIDAYLAAFTSACAGEVADEVKPLPSMREVRDCTSSNDWSTRFKATVGGLEAEDARRVLLDESLLTSLLAHIARRDRALILLLELAAFHAWKPEVKFEKAGRDEACRQFADDMAAPVGAADFDLLDRELKQRAKKLQGTNWKRLVPLFVGGAALGVATGGLAAPLIGTAIGGAMGLSGAAATSAGLALLGGGSVAAGGAGMAGGMALVGTLGGMAGAASGYAGDQVMSRDALLTESVKLDLLTELVLLKERKEAHHVSSILEVVAAQVGDIKRAVKELEDARTTGGAGWADSLKSKAKAVVARADDELEEMKERLSILEDLRDGIAKHLETFIELTEAWIAEGGEAVDAIKKTANPSLLLAIKATEEVVEGADRVSRIVPAILMNDGNIPLASLVVDLMQGQVVVEGEEALRARGIKNQLLVEVGGAAIDVLGHPLLWAATGVAAAGAQLGEALHGLEAASTVIPAGLTADWLQARGIDFGKLAEAVVKILEREARELGGGAAIDIAEGIKLTLEAPVAATVA